MYFLRGWLYLATYVLLIFLTVSNIHAEIEASGDQGSTWICDLNSSNKTKLNDLILKPNRSYELKDGSVIEFGKVSAVYRKCRSTNDMVIPETPAPARQKGTGTIIPNTPDSSFNNSSAVDSDGSIILGTQGDEETGIFRQPLIPRQRQSNISKQNSSIVSCNNESDDSQIVLHTSDTNVDENQGTNIFDMETQNFEKGHSMVSDSIYDVETQKFSTDASEHSVEANTKASKQFSKPDVQNKTTGNSATDIHDLETQIYMSDISELETQRSKENIEKVTAKKLTTNIYDVETQNCISDSDKGDIEVQEFKNDKNKSREGNLDQIEHNIDNLETQRLNNKRITEDISDMETQLELDGTTNATNDISDQETQLQTNDEQADKDKNKDNAVNTIKSGTSYENMGLLRSGSSSPRSLNLSSPGIDEDAPSSPLNQSGHLLESSDLLEFFAEGIDKSDEVQTCNAVSTPKSRAKASSGTENSSGNRSNTPDSKDEDDVENIFDAPTQLVNPKFETSALKDADKEDTFAMRNLPQKKRETSRSKQTDDDSETDAEEYIEELAKKERESSNNESASKKNDPGTSVESEDMFDVPTQRFNDRVIDDTSNSSINRLSNMNETDVVDNAAHDQDKRTDISSMDIDDMKATQLILPQKASDSPSKNNQNDVDDMAPTQIINANINAPKSIIASENLDQEDIDYEMAPTQIIGEERRNFEREKTGKSSNVNLNDTIEQNLNEMFDDICSENIHESQQMSTQNLEKILDSSASDNDLSTTAADKVLQTRLRKKKHASYSQSSRNSSGIKTNADNNVDTDSQNSDTLFITTKRKRNIIKDTQELVESMEDTPSENANSSHMSKADNEKTEDNSAATRSSKRRKRLPKLKNKSDTDPTLNDDDISDTSETKKTNLRRMRSMKPSDGATSERVLEKHSSKVAADDAENSTTESNIYAPCPLRNGQGVEISNAFFENDDDILSRLPAVRISGTLSNPGSPSASSTSTVHTVRSKQRVTKDRNKKKSKKSLRKQSVEDSEKDKDLNEVKGEASIPLLDNSSSLETRKSKILNPADSSEDSDCDLNIRFKQVAERILTKQPSYQKSRNKGSIQNASDSAVPDEKRNMRTSNVSKNPKQNADADAESTNLRRASSRLTRQNDESSRASKEEDSAERTAAKFIKSETKSVVRRKRGLNATEENVEDTNLKKRKANQVIEESAVSTRGRRSVMKAADRQFPNNLESAKSNSRENSPVIESTKSSKDSQAVSKAAAVIESQKVVLNPKTDENADSGRSNVKRTRRKINESQTTASTSADENSSKNKQIQTKEEKTNLSLIRSKHLKIVLSPVKIPMTSSVRDESQEVEMIMGTILSDVHDKNLSIRESSSAKIFKKESRIGRRNRASADIKTDSTLTESSVSSDVDDSDNCAPKAKRGKLTKSSVPSQTRARVSEKKEIFKRPTRANKTSILDSSMESTTDRDSLCSSRSDVSSSSRASRSRTAGARRKEKIGMHQSSPSDDSRPSSRMNTSLETTSPVSVSSRTRRSMSILSNLTPTSTRHRILFTGITEDYSKIVKTLGGIKVEEPAKCSVLVTDKVRRTYKFLCTLAQGVPVVSIDWLKDSESAARFLDWEGYILKDPAAEAKFGFRLRKSLEKAKEKRLLDGYTVVLTPGVAPPPVQELKDMVKSSGAKALLRPPAKWSERTVIISREEDLSNARKFLAKAPKAITIQSTEFILTGILRQEMDFDKFRLM
nr:PREDICTED: LOW QUALITY PROTEIN: dentin sialophosphoprotein [Linepithema humile]